MGDYMLKRVTQALAATVGLLTLTLPVVVALIVAPFFFSAQVWAQTTQLTISGCGALSWTANVEPDLAGYYAYVSQDGVTQPKIKIEKDLTMITCEALGMVEGHAYVVGLRAFDTSGNEGLMATPEGMTWLDITPPGLVTNICWDVEVIVIDTEGKIVSVTPEKRCELQPE